MNWLEKIFHRKGKTISNPPQVKRVIGQEQETGSIKTNSQAILYLEHLQEKVSALAQRFASGAINRQQFQELFSHYQEEIQNLEQFLSINPESDEWKSAVTEGRSILIRRNHIAHLKGYSIYNYLSGLPIRTGGNFGLDPALFVPMLFAYQSATREIFGGGVRSTQIEGGDYLCFVQGKFSTTLALFSTEPAGKQLKSLEHLHQLFEDANSKMIIDPDANEERLVCPHEYFLSHPL